MRQSDFIGGGGGQARSDRFKSHVAAEEAGCPILRIQPYAIGSMEPPDVQNGTDADTDVLEPPSRPTDDSAPTPEGATDDAGPPTLVVSVYTNALSAGSDDAQQWKREVRTVAEQTLTALFRQLVTEATGAPPREDITIELDVRVREGSLEFVIRILDKAQNLILTSGLLGAITTAQAAEKIDNTLDTASDLIETQVRVTARDLVPGTHIETDTSRWLGPDVGWKLRAETFLEATRPSNLDPPVPASSTAVARLAIVRDEIHYVAQWAVQKTLPRAEAIDVHVLIHQVTPGGHLPGPAHTKLGVDLHPIDDPKKLKALKKDGLKPAKEIVAPAPDDTAEKLLVCAELAVIWILGTGVLSVMQKRSAQPAQDVREGIEADRKNLVSSAYWCFGPAIVGAVNRAVVG